MELKVLGIPAKTICLIIQFLDALGQEIEIQHVILHIKKRHHENEMKLVS